MLYSRLVKIWIVALILKMKFSRSRVSTTGACMTWPDLPPERDPHGGGEEWRNENKIRRNTWWYIPPYGGSREGSRRGVLTFIVGWYAKRSRQKNPQNVNIYEVLHPLILGKAVQKLFLTDPLGIYQSYISHK